MPWKIFLSALTFILLIITSSNADEHQRFNQLKSIFTSGAWEKITTGEQPWPDELYPLSTWSKKDKKMKHLIILKGLDILVGDEINQQAVNNSDILELRYVTRDNKEGFKVNGTFSETEKEMDESFYSWCLLTGIQGTLCMRAYYDEGLTQKADALTLQWSDDKETGTSYYNHLAMSNFKSPTHHFCIEWNVVPFFWNMDPKKYNRENLDLVLKREDNPLSYSVDGQERVTLNKTIHVSDIGIQLKAYKN